MQCPYREFQPCLVENCPSCEYETEEEKKLCGRAPIGMEYQKAIESGYCWYDTKKTYRFKACKLIENGVPLPSKSSKKIDNSKRVSVIKQSLL